MASRLKLCTRGVSLLELLVYLALSSIVVSSALTFLSSNLSLQKTKAIEEQQEESFAQVANIVRQAILESDTLNIVDNYQIQDGKVLSTIDLDASILLNRNSSSYCSSRKYREIRRKKLWLALSTSGVSLVNLKLASTSNKNCKNSVRIKSSTKVKHPFSFPKLNLSSSEATTYVLVNQAYSIYLSEGNDLRMKSWGKSENQPLVYGVESFKIERINKETLELQVKIEGRSFAEFITTPSKKLNQLNFLNLMF